MKLIVGLGNPDLKHEKTRHNLGFMVVDAFLKNYSSARDGDWQNSDKFQSKIVQIDWQPKKGKEEKIILTKPKTYMNNSGMAVSNIVRFYKITPQDIWVIHDDLDLPLGSMKIRFGGASAGHKGVESIIEKLGNDRFWRFRLGIGKQSQNLRNKTQKYRDVDNFVLGEFEEGERGKSRIIIKRCRQAIEGALENGLEKAMNRFNIK